MAKQRLQFVDMAKGLAIVFLVFYHILAPSPLKTVATCGAGGSLYLFFALSGYFYAPGKRSLKENLAGKAKALLIPFFGYSLSFWGIGTLYYLISGTVPFVETLYCLRNFYAGCIWNRTIQGWFSMEYYNLGKRYLFLADFWFLLALFFAYILFLIIADKVMKSKVKETAAVVLLLAVTGVLRGFQISLPYNLQLIPFWTAFLLLGAIMREREFFKLPFMRGVKAWLISIVAVTASAAVWAIPGYGVNIFRGEFNQPEPVTMAVLFLCGMIFTWGLGNLCRLLEETGMRVKELAWLGSHSLYVFLFHMLYAWLISTFTGFSLQYKDDITGETLVISILISLAALALSILTGITADFIKKKPAGHKKEAKE